MPQPMEDEVEICQNGDKGRLWLILLNDGRQGVPSSSACLDLVQCDTERRSQTGMNEELLCAGKKQTPTFMSVEFVPMHSLNTAPLCLARPPSL